MRKLILAAFIVSLVSCNSESTSDSKKTESNKETEKPQAPVNTKKKKLVIIAIVCLLAIAVGSKLVNKHLKKKKAQELPPSNYCRVPREVAEAEGCKAFCEWDVLSLNEEEAEKVKQAVQHFKKMSKKTHFS